MEDDTCTPPVVVGAYVQTERLYIYSQEPQLHSRPKGNQTSLLILQIPQYRLSSLFCAFGLETLLQGIPLICWSSHCKQAKVRVHLRTSTSTCSTCWLHNNETVLTGFLQSEHILLWQWGHVMTFFTGGSMIKTACSQSAAMNGNASDNSFLLTFHNYL